MVRFFILDFEASSLLPGTYPIEIGWIDQDGVEESHLIRPLDNWLSRPGSWSRESEEVHGISLERLFDEGEPAIDVARRALDILLTLPWRQEGGVYGAGPGHFLFSDAPGFDSGWMSKLIEAANIQRDVKIRPIEVLYRNEGMRLTRAIDPELEPRARVEAIREAELRYRRLVSEAEMAEEEDQTRIQHRALDDARSLYRRWRWLKDAIAVAVGDQP